MRTLWHRRIPALVLVATVLATLAGCGRARSASRVATADVSTRAAEPDAAASEAGLAPIAGELESLSVAGHPDAFVSLPTGATGRRPVVVVVHGTGDRPDWQCEGWRSATAQFPFIVCPTGFHEKRWSTKADTRYTHIGGAPLLAYIDASLAALARRYPDYADTRTPLLAGFSLGASEILSLAVKDPARFPRIALIEGGSKGWTRARIEAYVRGGGKRVLYGAGQAGVDRSERAATKRLLAGGLDARVTYVPVGHNFDQRLVDAIGTEMPWLVSGDARWDGMTP
jgi:poly(3-hydroxybutyrate) depolymerase